MRPAPSSLGLDASQPLRRTGGGRPGLVLGIVLSLYLAIAVAWLWPLMADPAATRPTSRRTTRSSSPATAHRLGAGAIRALVTAPLFDANTFHPSPKSARLLGALSRHGALFAPTYWATGSDPRGEHCRAAHPRAQCDGDVLLAWRFTHPTGAFVAGFLYAFSPQAAGSLMHVHLLGVSTSHWRSPVPSAGSASAVHVRSAARSSHHEAATSFYRHGQMLGYGAYRVAALHWRGRLDRRRVLGVAAAIAAVGLSMALLSLPYLALQREGVIPAFGEPGQRPAGLAPAWVNLEIVRYLFRYGIGNVGYVLVAGAICFVLARDIRYGVCLGLAFDRGRAHRGARTGGAPLREERLDAVPRLLADIVPGFSTVRLHPGSSSSRTSVSHLLAGIGLGAESAAFARRSPGARRASRSRRSSGRRAAFPAFPSPGISTASTSRPRCAGSRRTAMVARSSRSHPPSTPARPSGCSRARSTGSRSPRGTARTRRAPINI